MVNNFKWKHKLCKKIEKSILAKVYKNEKVINVERKNKKKFLYIAKVSLNNMT